VQEGNFHGGGTAIMLILLAARLCVRACGANLPTRDSNDVHSLSCEIMQVSRSCTIMASGVA
jgi:hypothetical protein